MSKNPSKTVNYLFAFDLLVKRRTFSFLASQLLAVRLVSVLIFCCQKERTFSHLWIPQKTWRVSLSLCEACQCPCQCLHVHCCCSVHKLSLTLFLTPWTAARQDSTSLSVTISQSWLKLTTIESVKPSNHLILCRPLLLPSILTSIRVFSNESAPLLFIRQICTITVI